MRSLPDTVIRYARCLVAGALVLLATPARAQFPIVEPFSNASAPGWVLEGSALLTGGWLRLIGRFDPFQVGMAYYDVPLPFDRDRSAQHTLAVTLARVPVLAARELHLSTETTLLINGGDCNDDVACTADICDPTSARADVRGCFHSSLSCGDGVVQRNCGEGCDDGPGNGGDDCCSAVCEPVDADGDQVCDAADPCTGPALVFRPQLMLGRLDTPPGDDTLSFKGGFTLPAGSQPDPIADGVRILVTDFRGRNIVDTTVPGGAFDPLNGDGWVRNTSGTRFRYFHPGPAAPGGIGRIVLQYRSGAPVRFKFSLRGKNGDYALPSPGVALVALLVLDPPAARTGQCAVADFSGPAPAPTCAFDPSFSTYRCR